MVVFDHAVPWAFYDPKQDLWTLKIRVQPGARTSCVVGEHNGCLKLKIAALAVDNKANECLAEFLSRLFGVGRSQVWVIRGGNARQKIIAVQGAGHDFPDLRVTKTTIAITNNPKV